MKKIVLPALAALMAMNVSFAFAWSDVTGVIKSINATSHELVLDDGKTYAVNEGVNLADLKAGDKVTITAQEEGGKNMVNKVIKAS